MKLNKIWKQYFILKVSESDRPILNDKPQSLSVLIMCLFLGNAIYNLIINDTLFVHFHMYINIYPRKWYENPIQLEPIA